ncbi:MAG: DNA repair exonuclease [Candidatus Lokiarchaeota archaeon]|nr:DNA repair exonuclease [Candidatus Lokiarchaeota archaeon]
MMKVKFAHISDVHLGAWRNERLNELGYKAFEETVNSIIKEEVDFVVNSGDLYDVSNPKVEVIDVATRELKKLKDHEIPVYGICGSHDFSPSNKSMIRPLITAGLFINVSEGVLMENGKLKLNFYQDQKTQIKITGLRARKRSLEIEDYRILDRKSLESEKGSKIFILHTMLSELKPKEYKDMKSAPKSLLPQDFDYYAGGHLHKTLPEKLRIKEFFYDINRKNNIVYSGCIFPTDFREFETIKFGGFCIISGENDGNKLDLKVKYIPVKVIDVENISLDCTNKSASDIQNLLKQEISKKNLNEKIVTVRIYGPLSSGKTYEIKSNEIIQNLKDMGAFEVLVNKNALTTVEYQSISVSAGKSKEEIEATLIKEHASKVRISDFPSTKMENKIYQLLSTLGIERQVGTKVMNYNESLKQSFLGIFEIQKSKEPNQ